MDRKTVKEALKQVTKDELRDLIKEHGEDIITAAIACDVQLEDISEAYQGQYAGDAEFVQQLLEGCGDIPKLPHYIYIDWERTSRDVMMDYSESEGHYFRNL